MNNLKILVAILLLIESLNYSKTYTSELTKLINKMIDDEQ